ncbi:MAG: hypothetical protein WB562_15605 [Candidatus Sulfotelmatobacter sp.]
MLKSRMDLIRYAICLALLATGHVWAQEPQTAVPATTAPAATSPVTNPYLREASITENKGATHISANSPRPLAQVLDALRQKYGWIVDYEDPRYVSTLDVVERPGGAIHSLPAGGSFTVDVPADSAATAPPPEDKTLQSIVDAYNQSKNPGRFELRKNEDRTYLVSGIGARDENGKVAAQEAIFDLTITMPKQQSSASETLELLCQKIAEPSHVKITVGVTPRKIMDYTKVNVGGTKVQARILLSRILEATGHTMYWRLLFDPDSKGYYLDIHAVQRK